MPLHVKTCCPAGEECVSSPPAAGSLIRAHLNFQVTVMLSWGSSWLMVSTMGRADLALPTWREGPLMSELCSSTPHALPGSQVGSVLCRLRVRPVFLPFLSQILSPEIPCTLSANSASAARRTQSERGQYNKNKKTFPKKERMGSHSSQKGQLEMDGTQLIWVQKQPGEHF